MQENFYCGGILNKQIQQIVYSVFCKITDAIAIDHKLKNICFSYSPEIHFFAIIEPTSRVPKCMKL